MKINIHKNFPWLIYFIERLYPLVSVPLIIGYSISGGLISKGYIAPFPFLLTTLLLLFIFFYLRVKNDLEDFEKDLIVFPNRPLPRGLISRHDVQVVVQYLEYILIGILGLIFILYPSETKLVALLVGGFLWLMSKRFYLNNWNKRSPLLREILAQAFFIPLTLLIIAIWFPSKTFSLNAISYALVIFGAFFVSNLARKLDPFAHPAILSLTHYYGFHITYYIALVALCISGVGAYGLGNGLWLWPCEAGMLLVLSRLFKKPKQFHLAEMASLFSLFIHVWSGIFLI